MSGGLEPDPPSDAASDAAAFEGLVARTGGLQPWRRAFHAASGVALALGPGLLGLERDATLAGLAALLGAAVLLDLARLRVRRVNTLFFRVLTPLVSPREARRPASSTWYLVGVLLVWAFLPGRAVSAVLVLALADPVASLVGRRWGRRPLGKGSVEGGAAFVAVAAAVLLLTTGSPVALAAALVAGVVELLPLPLDDNLTVPVVAAATLAALGV